MPGTGMALVGDSSNKLRAVFHCLIPRVFLGTNSLPSDWGNTLLPASIISQQPKTLGNNLSSFSKQACVQLIHLTLLALGTSSCSAFILSAILSLRSCKTATATTGKNI